MTATFLYKPNLLLGVTATDFATAPIGETTSNHRGIQYALSDLLHALKVTDTDNCTLIIPAQYARDFATTVEMCDYIISDCYTPRYKDGFSFKRYLDRRGLPARIYGIPIAISDTMPELLPVATPVN